MTKNKNGKNVTHLEIAEGVLDYCNVINNDYQNNSTVFCIFVPNKCFSWLLDVSPKNLIFGESFNWGISYIEV